ncbi:ADP-ribose pyrophosphatase; mitochondrial [Camelus dromedarius]|uniref:ADP-ribose pyrophosphatase, mitochondrial n=1 Tax=Camelus dromedarius TaxID=9838 RepID=A0A5N4DIV0_CAMDR|nr:ADP-ribose pyrophosphatase; mitochondrial [Camelus dromedarius]
MDGWTLPGKGFEDRVSLSVALASMAVKPSSCPDISVGWSPFSSRGFPPDFTMSVSDGPADTPHKKARTSPYPGSTVERTAVPDEKAADPILTRWKNDGKGNKVIHPVSGRNILQFVAIKRKDCGEWAIPGGMVDPGEKISSTLKREFGEEAMNSLQKSRTEAQELEKQLHKLFSQEHFVVYKGYVDDPRNTDDAWMETEVVNYHEETGEVMAHLPLEAGDDAKKVRWVDINDKIKLYASHSQFIQLVAEKRGAHWREDVSPDCHG